MKIWDSVYLWLISRLPDVLAYICQFPAIFQSLVEISSQSCFLVANEKSVFCIWWRHRFFVKSWIWNSILSKRESIRSNFKQDRLTPISRLLLGVFMSCLENYRKDTEPLYHSLMYSFVSLLSSIYPLPAMHSLLFTLYVMEYLISINQRILCLVVVPPGSHWCL